MKMHVLFDNNGEIVAASLRDGKMPVRVQPMPDPQAGHRIAEVYVPAEYAHYDLAGICQRMKIDTKGTFARLEAK
jgi:hypothetical protein